jgi:hypothetical protein
MVEWGIRGKVSTEYGYRSILDVVEHAKRGLLADPEVQRSVVAEVEKW